MADPKKANGHFANTSVAKRKNVIAPASARTVSASKKSKGSSPQVASNRPTKKTPSVGPKIFQIFYEPMQRELLDPAFIPLDNRGKPSQYLEFDLFGRLAISDQVENVPLWGALSWRFTEKTGLSGANLLHIIEENPGQDVYFCNPYPKHEALFHNLWVQGETAHPRFLELSRAFLLAADLPVQETEVIWPSSIYSSANYFVGTPAFWKSYLGFVSKAIRRADAALPVEIKAQLESTEADDRNIHSGSSYMPFIVERLFPLFLRSVGKDLKAFKIPLPVLEEELDVHLRLLRQMKDEAHRSKSVWLAACWANYRSLYFTQQHGADWTRKYLRAVTPLEFKFA